MFSKMLGDHLDESVKRILDTDKITVYENSKKYWTYISAEKSDDIISESSQVDKLVTELTRKCKNRQKLVESLGEYLSQSDSKLTENQKAILESTKRRLMKTFHD